VYQLISIGRDDNQAGGRPFIFAESFAEAECWEGHAGSSIPRVHISYQHQKRERAALSIRSSGSGLRRTF